MSTLIYREMRSSDILHLAEMRAKGSATKEYWVERITNYSEGLVNPQEALRPRVIYVAVEDTRVVGFAAGHLTRRFNCEGELQWIDTVETHRRRGIASGLIIVLAKWFIRQQAYKICVDPGNHIARTLYNKNGAVPLNEHWLYWTDIRDIIQKPRSPIKNYGACAQLRLVAVKLKCKPSTMQFCRAISLNLR